MRAPSMTAFVLAALLACPRSDGASDLEPIAPGLPVSPALELLHADGRILVVMPGPTLYSSTDGLDWSVEPMPSLGGEILAAGAGGTSALVSVAGESAELEDHWLYSQDGDTWHVLGGATRSRHLWVDEEGGVLSVEPSSGDIIYTPPFGFAGSPSNDVCAGDSASIAKTDDDYVLAFGACVATGSPTDGWEETRGAPQQGRYVETAAHGVDVLVGTNLGYAYISRDGGSTWSESDTGTGARPTDAAVGPPGYVLSLKSGFSVSSDGTSWTTVDPGAKDAQVVWDGSRFLAVDAVGRIFESADALSWSRSDPVRPFAHAMAVREDRVVMLAESGWDAREPILLVRPDVESDWELYEPPSDHLTDIVATEDGFIAVDGEDGEIFGSGDGITWSGDGGSRDPLRSIAYDGSSVLVTVSAADSIYVSQDGGDSWQPTSPLPDAARLDGVRYTGGAFFAFGDDLIIRSPDGLNWTRMDHSVLDNVTGITGLAADAERLLVAAGEIVDVPIVADGCCGQLVMQGPERDVAIVDGRFIIASGSGDIAIVSEFEPIATQRLTARRVSIPTDAVRIIADGETFAILASDAVPLVGSTTVNQPPSLDSIPLRRAEPDEIVDFNPSGRDPEGNPVRFSLRTLVHDSFDCLADIQYAEPDGSAFGFSGRSCPRMGGSVALPTFGVAAFDGEVYSETEQVTIDIVEPSQQGSGGGPDAGNGGGGATGPWGLSCLLALGLNAFCRRRRLGATRTPRGSRGCAGDPQR